MACLLKSFFYKLFRDGTFKVVAIVGAGLAVLLSCIYAFWIKGLTASGAYGLLSSISPFQNFGLAIPINLVIFISLLFTQGIIRNEIIVGNSKLKVYFSMLIGGIAFTLGLILLYMGLTVGLLSLFSGGFFTSTFAPTYLSVETILEVIGITILNYTLLTAFTLFVSTTIRSVGGSTSVVIIPIVILSVFSMVVVSLSGIFSGDQSAAPEILVKLNKYLNPQYAIGKISAAVSNIEVIRNGKMVVTTEDFIITVINNLVFAGIFTAIGAAIFKHSDVK